MKNYICETCENSSDIPDDNCYRQCTCGLMTLIRTGQHCYLIKKGSVSLIPLEINPIIIEASNEK